MASASSRASTTRRCPPCARTSRRGSKLRATRRPPSRPREASACQRPRARRCSGRTARPRRARSPRRAPRCSARRTLDAACRLRGEYSTRLAIDDVVTVCEGTGNQHFQWFANLLAIHIDGIAGHATHAISSGKVEGANDRIETIRRQGYGYLDDEYFFPKVIDSSRRRYVEDPKSHRFCD
ncbi:transposase [Ellagibacter isourolithinifaciens]|uniref:transposase n=1 Tax=Ellagibacter isourolithinifaciens TaxID=2137581 RepID=UPI003A8DB593